MYTISKILQKLKLFKCQVKVISLCFSRKSKLLFYQNYNVHTFVSHQASNFTIYVYAFKDTNLTNIIKFIMYGALNIIFLTFGGSSCLVQKSKLYILFIFQSIT